MALRRFTANTGMFWKPSFLYSAMAELLSCSTERSMKARLRAWKCSARYRVSASPMPGWLACGETANAHRLAPGSASPKASAWSSPMATPITSPVCRSSASA